MTHTIEFTHALIANGTPMNPMPVRMFEACSHSEHEVLQSLVDQGHDVNHVWPGSLTMLHVASSRGDARTAEILLIAGANANACTAEGKTPLILAAEKGHSSLLPLLRRFKADLNVSSHRGNTALHAAISARHFECACHLLWMGARGDLRNMHGLRAEDMAPVMDQPAQLINLLRAARLRDRRATKN